MTAFTITTPVNITSLTPKQGGDTYSINGGAITINSDTRYGPNTSTTTGAMGNLTVSATLGGGIRLEGASVRLIPYDGGSGTAPASGAMISQSGVSCELLCVMTTRTGGLVLTGVLPATGWLKVRGVVGGSVTAGPLTGISASATGPDETGWIVVVGVEALGHSNSRLGTMDVDGRSFTVGTTSGVRGQSVQLPHFTADVVTAYPGVDVETSPGSGLYEFWANVGPKFRGDTISTDSRSRFVGITDSGLATFGLGRDLLQAGDMPVAGCNIRIPNIILQSCSPSSKATTSVPSNNMGSRYESSFSNAGRLTHSMSTGAWYWNIVQPYSIYIRDMHTCDQAIIQEVATRADIDNLHIGLSNYTTVFSSNALVFQQNYNGGTIGTITAVRAEASNTSGYAAILVNLYGGWTCAAMRTGYASAATAISGTLFLNTCDDLTIDKLETIGKRVLISACNRTKLVRVISADNVTGTTGTTLATHVVEVMTQSADVEVLNIENWPGVANTHPYSGLIFFNTTRRSSLRYCGTPASPYNAGTANLMGYIFSDGGNNSDIRVQRNWTTALRLGVASGTNTTTRAYIENNYMVDPNKTIGPQQLNSTYRGNRHNSGSVPTSYVAVYGTCFWDAFTSDTTTRAALAMAEKSAYFPDLYAITAGTPVFTAQGAVVMRTAGDQVVWTWAWRILGWSGLAAMATTGTNTPNHSYEYDLDKGAGFSGVWTTLNSANLTAETGISPTVGFIPKIRATCVVAATTNRVDSIRIDGTTTLALQNAALYPLDTATLNISGLRVGSTVAVFAGVPGEGADTLALTVSTSDSAVVTYPYNPSVPTYTIRVRKAGIDPVELTYVNALTVNIPIAQQENKDGFGVPVYGRGPGTSSAFVTTDAPMLRVDIGNSRCVAEDVYDVLSTWQATSTGVKYSEALRFDGTDMLLLGSWRFRRALASYTSAGIDALPVIDGNSTGSPDDEANGSVDFKARSVRTYQINAAPAITAADMAAAVWGYAQGNGATAESNLRAARTAAENAFAVSA